MGAKGEKEVPWNTRLVELLDYKAKYGHCNVPCGWPENPRLAKWVMRQRQRYKQNQMNAEHLDRLKAIDFEFRLVERKAPAGPNTPWQERLRQLAQYKALHGHLMVKAKENPALTSWMSVQRFAWKQGKLQPERQAQLQALGFTPDAGKQPPVKVGWDERFEQLRQYKDEHGNFNVPVDGTEEEDKEVTQLGYWVRNQRMQHNHGKMRADRVAKMDSIGFPWRLRAGRKVPTQPDEVEPAESWKAKLEMLKAYKMEHGTCNVPRTSEGDDRKLSHWVGLQRARKAANKLSAYEIEELDKLGFEWVLLAKAERPGWQLQFEALKAFAQEHGHCKVPAKWEENPKLAKWVSKQREKYRDQKLAGERKAKLDSLGFTWSYIDITNKMPWESRVEALRQFKEKNGHCNVPKPKNVESEEDHLGRWLKFQKWRYKTGKMAPERAQELLALGVEMNKDDEEGGGRSKNAGTASRRPKPTEFVAVERGNATGPAIFTSNAAARPHIMGNDKKDLSWASYTVEHSLEAAKTWLMERIPGMLARDIPVYSSSLIGAPAGRRKSIGGQAKKQKTGPEGVTPVAPPQ